MPCPYERKWDRIADAMLSEACDVAAVSATSAMKERVQAAGRKATPFALDCGNYLATCPGTKMVEIRLQPEVAVAEALWRFMAGEAGLLEARIREWLHLSWSGTWADEAMIAALEQLVYQRIGEVILREHIRLAA
jgi:hypothetical protein